VLEATVWVKKTTLCKTWSLTDLTFRHRQCTLLKPGSAKFLLTGIRSTREGALPPQPLPCGAREFHSLLRVGAIF